MKQITTDQLNVLLAEVRGLELFGGNPNPLNTTGFSPLRRKDNHEIWNPAHDDRQMRELLEWWMEGGKRDVFIDNYPEPPLKWRVNLHWCIETSASIQHQSLNIAIGLAILEATKGEQFEIKE